MSPQPAPAAARIGPNAIIRVAEALGAWRGPQLTGQVFRAAGLGHYLARPPQKMVDEAEVQRLHAALRRLLGREEATEIARAAGRATADYLLTHRIPRPVQTLLAWLPAVLAARVLLQAIGRNAWTFVGSGRFSSRAPFAPRSPAVLCIEDNPLCRGLVTDTPACDFYAATFERLFQVLVHPNARVVEVACEALGDGQCRFEIGWSERWPRWHQAGHAPARAGAQGTSGQAGP